MNLQYPLHSSGKYVIICLLWIHLKLLTLLFHSYFLTLPPAVIQLFIALPQTPSTHQMLVWKEARVTQQQSQAGWTLKVVSHSWWARSSSTDQRGRDPAGGNAWGSGSPLLRPLSKVVWLSLCWGPQHPPLVMERQWSSPATRQSRAGGSLLAEPLFFLSHVPLPDWKSLVSHEWLVWLSILPALVCNPPRWWEEMTGVSVCRCIYIYTHMWVHHTTLIYVCV